MWTILLAATVAVDPATMIHDGYEDRLRELAAALEARLEARRTQRYDDLLAGSSPGARGLNEAPEIQLEYVDETGRPVYAATITLDAAKSIRTDEVWPGGAAGLSLDGSGTEMGMWDGGDPLWNHQELAGRMFDMDGPGGSCSHATWVAGVLIGTGLNPQARGMCFAADLLSYDLSNDSAEMAIAAVNGMRVSNHSYETPGGWRPIGANWYWFGDLDISTSEDYGFGFYGDKSRTWDEIVYNAPYYFVQKGCGNDRFQGPAPGTGHFHFDNQLGDYVFATDTHPLDGADNGLDCISWFGNAKNIVAVGAVLDIPNGYTSPNDVIPTSFTSYGPCDDGRIKPDIVANGWELLMPDCSAPTAYDSLSGTSLSGPCVAGSANLLRVHYQTTIGSEPRAATLKALLFHTADEAGPWDGPDYAFGWGLMNTRRAADLISAGADYIREAHLVDQTTHTYNVRLVAAADLRVMINWTDPPGTPPAPSIDPPDKALVNDLDLRVQHVQSGAWYRPWILDKDNPFDAAVTGDNVVDNTEQVHIADADAGDYIISVTHKGSLVDGGQSYSIVSTTALDGCPADLDGDGSVGIGDFLELLGDWGPCANCPADLDGDGFVGIADFLQLLASWGPCPA